MNLISWNVNGLRAALKRGSMDWIKDNGPDVLCLQETKLGNDLVSIEVEQFAGYTKFHSSADRPGYSGVAIYSKVEPVSVKASFGAPEFDNEGRHLITDFGVFVLANVYFPNGRMSAERLAYKLAYYDAFLKYADEVTQAGKHLIVCGDFNTAHKEIDLARPNANKDTSGFLPAERAWMDRFVAHGFVDTFRLFNQSSGEYSWWSQRTGARERNVGWRLDYFFVDQGFVEKVRRSWIMPDVMGSDHCPVGLELLY